MLLKMCKFSNTSFNQTYEFVSYVLPYLFFPFIKVYSRHVAKRLRYKCNKSKDTVGLFGAPQVFYCVCWLYISLVRKAMRPLVL